MIVRKQWKIHQCVHPILKPRYNPGAKIFYEKLGYKYIGTIPSLYRKGIDEFLMMKVSE